MNIFNIRYIDQLAQWLAVQDFDYVYWNIMHDVWFFSISTLPEKVKKDLTLFLQGANVPEQYRNDIDRITAFMNSGASTDGFMMLMKIADLDRKREQDFASVSPEMAQLIDYAKNV